MLDLQGSKQAKMVRNGCMQASLRVVQCIVFLHFCQHVLPARGQRARVAPDIQTMLTVREELFKFPQNKDSMQDWDVEPYPCNWTRVDCDGAGTSTVVIRIDLSDRNLTGPIPGSIGSLPNLIHISGDGNHFMSIPSNFFKAKQLNYISFRNNLITGNILDRLSSFQSLRVLLLGHNLLSGRIDSLARLNHSAIQVIDLAGNTLTGNLSSLSDFSKLTSLWLGQNQLTGDLGAIQGMTSMRNLSLEENSFTGGIPFNTLSFMNFVNLSRNFLSGRLTLGEIFVPGFIDYLDLSDNRFERVQPEVLKSGNASAASFLDFFWARGVSKILLGGNGLAGQIVSFPESAATLNLSHNMLSGILPQEPKASFEAALETLLLNNNSFAGPVPGGLWILVNAVTIDLSRNQFNGSLPGGKAIFMPKLETLNLSRNEFSGPIPADITKLVRKYKLRSVDLSFNNFSGRLPPGLPHGENYTYSFTGNPGLCSDEEFFWKAYSLIRCTKASAVTPALWAGVGSSIAFIFLLGSVVLLIWRRHANKDYVMDKELIRAVSCKSISTKLIPLKALRKATDNFAEDAKIGEGAFGSVYRGTLDGKEVAIKKSSNAVLRLVESRNMFMNEVQIMSSVNHRYLVSLLGCCMTKKSAMLVFEYVPQGTLAEHLYFKRGQHLLDWTQRLKIARQTAEALNYLHFTASPPIYHRDVKSANILLDDDLNVKVADFGISKLAPNLESTHFSTLSVQGTPGYIDPEYYVSYQMTGKSDVYSFGVVLLELITSQQPLDHRRGERDSTLVKMATHLYQTNALHLLVDPTLMIVLNNEDCVKRSILTVAELAMRCVDRSPDDRPNINQVVLELEAISVKHHQDYVLKVDRSDLEIIPIATPISHSVDGDMEHPRSSYGSAHNFTLGPGSMQFPLPYGR